MSRTVYTFLMAALAVAMEAVTSFTSIPILMIYLGTLWSELAVKEP